MAAGPLVNVALLPVFSGLRCVMASRQLGMGADDARRLYVGAVDLLDQPSLLIFNMLPIYPLDGGQILRSLLWFPLGRARSLMVVTILGFVGIVGFRRWPFSRVPLDRGDCRFHADELLGRIAARAGAAAAGKVAAPEGFACPSCRTAPLLGEKWRCGTCGQPFDTFLTGGCLSALRGAVFHDDVRRLRQIVSHE
jgi:hypothetical protein